MSGFISSFLYSFRGLFSVHDSGKLLSFWNMVAYGKTREKLSEAIGYVGKKCRLKL